MGLALAESCVSLSAAAATLAFLRSGGSRCNPDSSASLSHTLHDGRGMEAAELASLFSSSMHHP